MNVIQSIILLLFSIWMTNSFAQSKEAIQHYNKGLEYYQNSQYDLAIPPLENAVKVQNDFYNAHRLLIICHEELGAFNLAIPHYIKAIEIRPQDYKLRYNLALTYIDIKKDSLAILQLREALAINQQYNKAQQLLNSLSLSTLPSTISQEEPSTETISREKIIYRQALKAYKNKEYTEAFTTLTQYSKPIEMADFYYLKGLCARALKHPSNQIIDYYDQCLKLEAHHYKAASQLGIIYYNEQKFKQASNCFSQLLEKHPRDYELLVFCAKSYHFDKKYKKAIVHFERALNQNDLGSQNWLLLSKSYRAIQQDEKADKALKKAGTTNPLVSKEKNKEFAKQANEASELSRVGKYSEAIEILEKISKDYPPNASIEFNLGFNFQQNFQEIRAKKHFERCIDIDPTFAKAYAALGEIYYNRELYSSAVQHFEAAIKHNMNTAFIYYQLASAYFKTHHYQLASKYFDQAISRNAQTPQFHFAQGLCQLKLKNYKTAIKSFNNLLQLQPDHINGQYHIGIAHLEMNQTTEAIQLAKDILDRDPTFAKAYLLIANAYKREGNSPLGNQYYQKAIKLDPSLR